MKDTNEISIAARLDVPPDVASSSHEYAKRFSGSVGEYFLELQSNITKKFLSSDINSKQNLTILDIGGGHCQLLNTYLDLGFEITVLGSDNRSFERLNDLGFNANPKIKTLICPINEISKLDLKFDYVSSFRMMAHVDDWKSFINDISQMSSRGLIIDFANLYTFNLLSPLLYSIKKKIEKNTRPFACQSIGQIRTQLNNSFTNVEFQGQFILPMGLHRKMKNVSFSKKVELTLNNLGLSQLGNPVIAFAKK